MLDLAGGLLISRLARLSLGLRDVTPKAIGRGRIDLEDFNRRLKFSRARPLDCTLRADALVV